MKQKITFEDIIKIVYPPLLYLGIVVFVEIVIAIAVLVSMGIPHISDTELEDILYSKAMEMNLAGTLCSIPFFAALMYYDVEKDKMNDEYKKDKTQKIWKYLLIIPLSFSSMMFGNNLLLIIESFLPQSMLSSFSEVDSMIFGGSFVIVLLSAGIFGPIVEELIFRGIVYKRLRKKSNFLIASVVSAFIFGLAHMNVVQFIYAFILGVIMAFLFETYGIFGSMLMHIVANTIVVIVSFANRTQGAEKTAITNDALKYAANSCYLYGVLTIAFIAIIIAVCRDDKNKKAIV